MLEVIEEEKITTSPLDPQRKNQSPGRNDQPLYKPPAVQKRLHCPRKLAVWGQWPLHKDGYHQQPQDFQSHSWQIRATSPACWLTFGYTLGAQLDLCSLGVKQVVITQITLTVDMLYHYQTRVLSQTSLHLDTSNNLDQPSTPTNSKNPDQIDCS